METLVGQLNDKVKKRISNRVQSIEPSMVRTVFEMAQRIEARGQRVIHLEIGRPWFDTPRPIKEAAKAALDAGHVHYSPNRGLESLRTSIASKLKKDNKIDADPETEIFVTAGNKQATYLTIMCLIEPGDEVIIMDPQYSPHAKEIEFAGGVPVYVPLSPADGWRLHKNLLADAVSKRTKLIFLNNPHNPTGRVFSKEELQAIADVAIENDLLVLTDETYEYIIFDGRSHYSLGSFAGMEGRTISSFAFTKSYAMDGWRLGYLVAPSSLTAAMVKMVQLDTACPNTFAQYGAIEAIERGKPFIDEMVQYDEAARTLFVERMNTMGFPCPWVEGTIHALPDLSAIHSSAIRAAEILLEECGIAATPGPAYGKQGFGRVRFSFGAVPHEELEEALNRIQRLGV